MASSSTPELSQQPQAQPRGRGMSAGRGQGRGRGGGRGRGRGRGRGQLQQFASEGQGPQHPQHEQTRGVYGGHRRAPRAVVWPKASKILVVDLEATCWESRDPPPGQKHEIIEIGWALVDLAGTDAPTTTAGTSNKNAGVPSIIRTGTVLVKPVRSEVSAFCTQLTTITAELLDAEGVPLRQAFKQLREDLQSDTMPWCSWGDYDRNMINRTCTAVQIDSPFSSDHYNVKDLCKELYPNLSGGYGMSNALTRVARETLEGTHHRGGDDAKNIAKILNFLVQEKKRRGGN